MEKKLTVIHDVGKDTILSDQIDLDKAAQDISIKHRFSENFSGEIERQPDGNIIARATVKI